MALNSQQSWRKIQEVAVNGLPFHRYESIKDRLKVGIYVELNRDPANQHDSRAVKVCLGVFQIGWVPRAVNRDIAERLDRGEVLRAVVVRHNPSDLGLEILVQDGKAEQEPATVSKFGGRASREWALAEFRRLPVGTVLILDSNGGRTSVSVRSDDWDTEYAWFRKSDISTSRAQSIDRGGWRAQVISSPVAGRFEIQLVTPDEAYPLPLPSRIEGKIGGISADSITIGTITATDIQNNPPKENTMNNISNAVTSTINLNKTAATSAAYLEAGRIANNKVSQLAAKALPMMVRGYADTSLGRLLLANAAATAAAQLRPNDQTLAKLTAAMMTSAYQEALQQFDFEGMLDNLLDSKEIKKALAKLPKDES